MRASPYVALVLGLLGCGIDPAKVPDHTLFADDSDKLKAGTSLSFAVVGNLREPIRFGDKRLRKESVHDGVREAVVKDIAGQMDPRRLSFVALMGDNVRKSTTREWKRFDAAFANLLDGASLPDVARKRIPVLPVAGERDGKGDRLLKGFDGAFPDVGADIGYNRVGSWSAMDATVGGGHWRVLVLDTNKKALGPRWTEQIAWIPQAAAGDDYDNLIVFMHHPLLTLATGRTGNLDGAPNELLETLDDAIGFQKLRAVFTGDPSTSEVFLVGGRFGTLHVGAGGGGAPADDLQRWGKGKDDDPGASKLEPIFDLAMLKAFDKRADQQDFPDRVLDAARAGGSYEGFPGLFDSRYFPLYGWWTVTLQADAMSASFRLWNPDGTFSDVYQADYEGSDKGWRIGS